MLDFAKLKLRRSPNQYLVAPPGMTPDSPHRAAPEFDLPAAALAARLFDHVRAQPRLTVRTRSADGLAMELVQRTRFFRFPDDISVRVWPLGAQRATLAIYSRARYGYRDFGVNRRRVDSWLAALLG